MGLMELLRMTVLLTFGPIPKFRGTGDRSLLHSRSSHRKGLMTQGFQDLIMESKMSYMRTRAPPRMTFLGRRGGTSLVEQLLDTQ